ncbi:hypothetical protein RHSIM_Rhsim11G0111900 [Rhododendron simsii]|uniref:MLO-like protein n=1 Tax=Rhododendron simsii TaxID=118357 RepID=A0A834LB19_RHOSS|nr:hypothetical protein RHSIM_Rhsim11G0111900 [Rhododendron simsii]
MVEESRSLEYTPTWVVAVVCFVIVLISLIAERGLHRLGKLLEHKDQDALFRALEKLKEELMLLGFISLLLNVSQGLIKHICIPSHLANYMLPCKWETSASEMHHEHHFQPTMTNGRRLLTTDTGPEDCKLKIRQWKHWEDSIRNETTKAHGVHTHHIHLFKQRATAGHWRKSVVGSWMLLLLVGAKLENIITRLAQVAAETKTEGQEAPPVKPSDELFWVLVQVLCSYSTLPLYALVTQMGSMYKQGIFEKNVQEQLDSWVGDRWKRGTQHHSPQINKMAKESFEDDHIAEETLAVDEGNTISIIELSPRT